MLCDPMSRLNERSFAIPLAAAAGGIAAYTLYTLFAYVVWDGYFDHVEPHLAIVAWQYLEGVPLYRDLASPDVQVNTYGPLMYGVQALALALFGGSMTVGKATAAVASALSVAVLAAHLWRRYGLLAAAMGTLFFLSFLLRHAPGPFLGRPDAFMILLTAAALAIRDMGGGRPGGVAAPLLLGACMGLAVNFKIYSAVFFLPVFVDLFFRQPYGQRWVSTVFAVGAGALACLAAPFALPGISAPAYIEGILGLLSGYGSSGGAALVNLKNALPYLLPVLVLAMAALRGGTVGRRDAVGVLVLAATTALVFYPAGKPGAGSHHFLPLAPIAAELLVRTVRGLEADRRLRLLALSVVPVFLLVISIPVQKRVWRNMNNFDAAAAAAEVDQAQRQRPGETMGMAFGETAESYKLSFLGARLVFAGHPVPIGTMSLMELKRAGVPLPLELRRRMLSCATRHWLVPKGEHPFAMGSNYGGGLFDGAFIEAFAEAYEPTQSLAFYDLWSCKGGG